MDFLGAFLLVLLLVLFVILIKSISKQEVNNQALNPEDPQLEQLRKLLKCASSYEEQTPTLESFRDWAKNRGVEARIGDAQNPRFLDDFLYDETIGEVFSSPSRLAMKQMPWTPFLTGY